jgi:hypothetical protein
MGLFFSACVGAIAFIATRTDAGPWCLHSLNDTFPIDTLRAMIKDAGWQDDDLGRLGLME